MPPAPPTQQNVIPSSGEGSAFSLFSGPSGAPSSLPVATLSFDRFHPGRFYGTERNRPTFSPPFASERIGRPELRESLFGCAPAVSQSFRITRISRKSQMKPVVRKLVHHHAGWPWRSRLIREKGQLGRIRVDTRLDEENPRPPPPPKKSKPAPLKATRMRHPASSLSRYFRETYLNDILAGSPCS